jgi:hypothetical protein
MNGKAALRKAKEFITAQGGEIAPLSISEEELNPDAQHDQSLTVDPLEPTETAFQVPYDEQADSACSEFRFFEDGRQRTVQIGYLKADYGEVLTLIPVHFFVIGAAILERVDRKLTLWDQPLIKQGIFVARSLVPDQAALDNFEQTGLEIVDTESSHGPPADYYEMRRRALRRAKERRLDIEQELIAKWRQDAAVATSMLVVDGTVMNMRDEKNVERCVGVSKSFGNRYFDISTHNRIMQMKEFQRSCAFRFHGEGEDQRQGARERVSWYLRIREGRNCEPEFGMIRVEIAKTFAKDAAAHANRISRSLLSERLPTAYPTPRWDKHLYPIRSCESYLSSVMPSISTITATMQG